MININDDSSLFFFNEKIVVNRLQVEERIEYSLIKPFTL